MHLLTRGRALGALVLALAALLAVTPVLATASDPGAIFAKKKKCKKGSKKKGCKKKKKAASGLPKPGTFLTSKNVRVNVGLQYPGKILIVSVSAFNLTANCSDGSTRVVGGAVTTPLKSKSFKGRKTYPEGNFAEASGTFDTPTKVSGTVKIGNVVTPDQGTCETPDVKFTAVKP